MTLADPSALDVALRVAGALEAMGVDYFLGGSLASSLQGEPRATNDIDIVVAMAPGDVDRFVTALGPEFDVDADALRRSLGAGASWNIFYTPVFLKIDLFPVGDAAFDASELARRRKVVVRRDGSSLVVKSPEDTILRKLLWYREGGEVSTTQWRDVVEVLRASRGILEEPYLDGWARRLAVEELLARARRDAAE